MNNSSEIQLEQTEPSSIRTARGLVAASRVLKKIGRLPSSDELLNIAKQALETAIEADKNNPLSETSQWINKLASEIHVSYLDATTPYAELISNRGFKACKYLIFADIDLNTVDGSALWMASVIRMLSLKAKVIVVSKKNIWRDAVVGDLVQNNNVLFVAPGNICIGKETLSLEQSIETIRELDALLPNLSALVIRGLDAVDALLADRQFYKRIFAYLTDLYTHTDHDIVVKDRAAKIVDVVSRQGAGFLVQTPELESLISQFLGKETKTIPLPPPVPESFRISERQVADDGILRIGYAGKIAPNWGIEQLAAWVKRARDAGTKIEVTIIGDKISAGSQRENSAFRHKINTLLSDIDARRLGALHRDALLIEMQRMDFAWCWRPPHFEEKTLELSTKMIEAAISGIPAICYPSNVNKNALGNDYTVFVKDYSDFSNIIRQKSFNLAPSLRDKLIGKHGIHSQAKNLLQHLKPQEIGETRTVTFAGHDLKFIHSYISELKLQGFDVEVDPWNWGEAVDEEKSREHALKSDIVFCEWGLANAVWYSQNLAKNKKLIIRIHAQEVRERARNLVQKIKHERVDKFIFVAEWVREEAIKLYGWPREKTEIIPNYILENEFTISPKKHDNKITLGMVGIVPSLKRFDRGLDLVKKLIQNGFDATLKVKGKRPEDIPFMHAPNRIKELQNYQIQYDRIAEDNELIGRVYFEDWGNDVALFYSGIDYILSPSENESFHYALADGVLSGCYPVIWDRKDVEKTYPVEWVVQNTDEAFRRITDFCKFPATEKYTLLEDNRAVLIRRYGSSRIYSALNTAIFGSTWSVWW